VINPLKLEDLKEQTRDLSEKIKLVDMDSLGLGAVSENELYEQC